MKYKEMLPVWTDDERHTDEFLSLDFNAVAVEILAEVLFIGYKKIYRTDKKLVYQLVNHPCNDENLNWEKRLKLAESRIEFCRELLTSLKGYKERVESDRPSGSYIRDTVDTRPWSSKIKEMLKEMDDDLRSRSETIVPISFRSRKEYW